MTPEDFAAWIITCRDAGIFSRSQPKRDAAKALDIADTTLTERLKGRVKISRETALACRAIAERREPWA